MTRWSTPDTAMGVGKKTGEDHQGNKSGNKHGEDITRSLQFLQLLIQN